MGDKMDNEFSLDDVFEKYATKPDPMAKPELILLYSQAGAGKGLAHGTPVATPSGWVPVEELDVDDLVIGSDGKPTRVYGTWHRGVLHTYKVKFSDGSSVTVDGDHLWTIRQRKDSKWFTTTTRDLIQRFADNTWSKYYSVPFVQSVEYAPVELPIPAYMLGGLLADGYLTHGTIQWTKNRQQTVDAMASSAALGEWDLVEITRNGSTARQWRFAKPDEFSKTQSLRVAIDTLGLNVKSGEKFIPDVYLTAGLEDRWELLHGLFDGDGRYRRARKSAEYTSTSAQLAKDVQTLCWSLGIPASLSDHPMSDGTWKVYLFHGDNPFRTSEFVTEEFGGKNSDKSPRQIVSITPDEDQEVTCIAVTAPDQLYVTKDYIVTHNTYLAGTAADLPDVKHVLYLDVEGSSVGVLSKIKSSDKIDVIRVDQQEKPFQFLATVLSEGKQGLFNPENKTKYDVVIVDTLDVAQDLAVEYFDAHAPIGSSGNKDTFAVWKNVKKWTLDIAKGLKQLDALGILVMHDREEKQDSGALIKRINAVGAAKDILPGVPDTVIYLERHVKKGVPITTAWFGTDDNKVTKDRFEFPPKVDGITIPWMYNYIDQKAKEKDANVTE